MARNERDNFGGKASDAGTYRSDFPGGMRKPRHLISSWLVFVLLMIAMILAPVSSKAEALEWWEARKKPRIRIGSCPYPKWNLKVLPTRKNLGQHRYRLWLSGLGFRPSVEVSRGHVYTRRGGFIDIAHLRRTVDLAGFIHKRLHKCLTERESHFSFESLEKTISHCEVNYPDFWDELPDDRRQMVIDELSAHAAAKASFDLCNWREIVTWYGFQNLSWYKEADSAFSYDDVPSHAIGSEVAARALLTPGVRFNEAVTRELEREMAELEIMPRKECERAIYLTKGTWWGTITDEENKESKTCLKRLIDTGLDDGQIEAWLIKGFEPGPAPRAKSFPAPRQDYSNVKGYDCSGMIVFECEPYMKEKDKVLKPLGPDVVRVRIDRDFPTILADIEKEILEKFGRNATVPYP